jgi:hypothetical protein
MAVIWSLEYPSMMQNQANRLLENGKKEKEKEKEKEKLPGDKVFYIQFRFRFTDFGCSKIVSSS